MEKVFLGNTGIEVTELCFGALPIGPNQKNVPPDEAAEVIAEALRMGINFIDTAQSYKTYPYIREAIRMTGIRPVIATKAVFTSYREMEDAVKLALDSLATAHIDIFLMHAPRVKVDVFEERAGALQCLLDYKARGVITAVGISTHAAPVTAAAAEHPEIDIVFPIINFKGIGIIDGDRDDMERAVKLCVANGKGVYLMKALGSGYLLDHYEEAMAYARGIAGGKASIAVGMVDKDEVHANVNYFNGKPIGEYLASLKKSNRKKFLVLDVVCKGCGACVKTCHSDAVSIVNDRAVIDRDKCLACGYCVEACESFAIRMV